MSAIGSEGVPEIIEVGGMEHSVSQLFSAQQIEQEISALGRDVAATYAERGGVHVVTVLEGARWFSDDLQEAMRQAEPGLSIANSDIRISSYEGTESTGRLRFHGPVPKVTGEHVVVAEDIFDTGSTLHGLLGALRLQRPASLEVAVLLDKDTPRRVPGILGDTVVRSCFRIGPEFVIGRGLDLDGEYRQLPGIHVLNERKAA